MESLENSPRVSTEEEDLVQRSTKKVKTRDEMDLNQPSDDMEIPHENTENAIVRSKATYKESLLKPSGPTMEDDMDLHEQTDEDSPNPEDRWYKDSDDHSDKEKSFDPCPTIKVTQEEFEEWCKPWRASLIVKNENSIKSGEQNQRRYDQSPPNFGPWMMVRKQFRRKSERYATNQKSNYYGKESLNNMEEEYNSATQGEESGSRFNVLLEEGLDDMQGLHGNNKSKGNDQPSTMKNGSHQQAKQKENGPSIKAHDQILRQGAGKVIKKGTLKKDRPTKVEKGPKVSFKKTEQEHATSDPQMAISKHGISSSRDSNVAAMELEMLEDMRRIQKEQPQMAISKHGISSSRDSNVAAMELEMLEDMRRIQKEQWKIYEESKTHEKFMESHVVTNSFITQVPGHIPKERGPSPDSRKPKNSEEKPPDQFMEDVVVHSSSDGHGASAHVQ
ncbi:hypothetical protein Ahy_A04g018459 isoform A [Arachis hypogaea]|uniref:Uncharacterized protein n=1 Tax=Arachis hypogaea TaxID=3818 RepID=A0A445DDQ0_ARAHY|nr:hypothetical protein Ahy_A04g018459 isoform A [Arachis hypogaea]